jgi:hypothetical protein
MDCGKEILNILFTNRTNMGGPESPDDIYYQIPNQYTIMDNKEVVSIHSLKDFLESPKGAPFFLGENTEVGCMDGRVKPEGALGLAGSGILLPRDPGNKDLPAKQYRDILVRMAAHGKLTKITWHKGHGGCGAAKLALKNAGNKNPTEKEIARAAQDFAENLTRFINAELKKSKSDYQVEVEEAPAEGQHGERGVYVDMTNRLDLISLNPRVDQQLPNGFTVNPRLTNDLGYVVEEIKVAISIAFGDHGLGKNTFTEKDPFFIMIANSQENPLPVNNFPDMIDKMIRMNYAEYANRIKIQTANVA